MNCMYFADPSDFDNTANDQEEQQESKQTLTEKSLVHAVQLLSEADKEIDALKAEIVEYQEKLDYLLSTISKSTLGL
jgi:hypothetical protein